MSGNRRLRFVPAAILLLAVNLAMAEQKKPQKPNAGNFSYYLLSLSYAPDFCAQPTGNKDPRECGTGRHIGFVVHGLWPQDDSGQGPQNCGPASPVAQAIVNTMLAYIPTPSLIQHEWATHGTCSGLSTADYFAAVRKARDSVTLPSDLNQPSQQLQLSPADLASKVAAQNPSFPQDAFRTSCYRDGELQELRVCFNPDLSPKSCTSSAGSCSIASITMLPVR
ncbi:MAG TPA: hypothetical protein VE959_03950 [Bryobacteraceae bacterium]|nr:hypothetical protein [Bryobacteraceae bacterium]